MLMYVMAAASWKVLKWRAERKEDESGDPAEAHGVSAWPFPSPTRWVCGSIQTESCAVRVEGTVYVGTRPMLYESGRLLTTRRTSRLPTEEPE